MQQSATDQQPYSRHGATATALLALSKPHNINSQLPHLVIYMYTPCGFLAASMMYLKLRIRLYPSSPTELHKSINSCSSHSRYALLRACAWPQGGVVGKTTCSTAPH